MSIQDIFLWSRSTSLTDSGSRVVCLHFSSGRLPSSTSVGCSKLLHNRIIVPIINVYIFLIFFPRWWGAVYLTVGWNCQISTSFPHYRTNRLTEADTLWIIPSHFTRLLLTWHVYQAHLFSLQSRKETDKYCTASFGESLIATSHFATRLRSVHVKGFF